MATDRRERHAALAALMAALALCAFRAMAHQAAGGKATHDVYVSPHYKKIHPLPVAPRFNGEIHAHPSNPRTQAIINADIVAQSGDDTRLWQKMQPKDGVWMFEIFDAFPGTEFVSIKGEMTEKRPGGGGEGGGGLSPFQFTVPEVDVDWAEYSSPAHEVGEDTRVVMIPRGAVRQFIVMRPVELADGMALPSPQRIPDMEFNAPAGLVVYATQEAAIAGDESLALRPPFLINKRFWHGAKAPASTNFFVRRATGGQGPAGKLEIKLTRKPTPFDASNATTYDLIKYELAPEASLKQVAFGGDGAATIHRDPKPEGPGLLSATQYGAPHWADNSLPPDGDADDDAAANAPNAADRKYPVCYARGTKMEISAEWRLSPAPQDEAGCSISNALVRGSAPGGFSFGPVVAAISGETMSIPNTTCSRAFDNNVDFHDPLVVAWQCSFDNGKTWQAAGASANPVYVTLGKPLTTLYHTLVHIGCKNAKGESEDNGTIEKVWGEFTDRVVKRVDGTPLTYYASYKVMHTSTQKLLAYGDGQCYAWVSFFLDTLRVQGIDRQDSTMEITPNFQSSPPTESFGFFVKNCIFVGIGSFPYSLWPYKNICPFPNYRDYTDVNSYRWMYAEVNDAPGIPGQSNGNPASLFVKHFTAFFNGKYYDPSYGQKFDSPQDIQNRAIGAFYKEGRVVFSEQDIGVDIDKDGIISNTRLEWYGMLFRKPDSVLRIKGNVFLPTP